MKRMLGIALVISGAVFSVFVLNLMLYSFVPAYRAALLLTAAGEDSSIPVIEVEAEAKTEVRSDDVSELNSEIITEADAEVEAGLTELNDETTPLSPIFEDTSSEEEKNKNNFEENKPQIVERTYCEDCGTGRGYWLLKYSDGSFGIE